jgi:hypothetical protein
LADTALPAAASCFASAIPIETLSGVERASPQKKRQKRGGAESLLFAPPEEQKRCGFQGSRIAPSHLINVNVLLNVLSQPTYNQAESDVCSKLHSFEIGKGDTGGASARGTRRGAGHCFCAVSA